MSNKSTFAMKSSDILYEEFNCYQVIYVEDWNSEYEGIVLKSNMNQTVRSRLAKKTPEKAGYFVAFWKKNRYGKNEPFFLEGCPDLLAIVVKDKKNKGIFIFPKEVAARKGILSSEGKIGKMGMRFYPPWCKSLNSTARKTQL